ncbi:MAG TPA: hypothetical protein VM537_23765 [Anaerolineae bacterium]|nr:hypothetical protein [Anaerolineae bacterium]
MKRERLTHYQAKCLAQELADETDAPCIIYRQWSVTGARHFGVVTNRHVVNWQLGASVDCVKPKEE